MGELVDEIVAQLERGARNVAETVAARRFEAWLVEHDRQIAETAWDFGWLARYSRDRFNGNPYRAQVEVVPEIPGLEGTRAALDALGAPMVDKHEKVAGQSSRNTPADDHVPF